MYATIILGLILAVFATDFVAGGTTVRPFVAVGGTVAVAVLVLMAGLAITGYILLRRRQMEGGEQRFLRTIGLLGRLYRTLIVGAYAFALFGCGWSRAAATWAGGTGWSVPVLAVNLVPLVVLLLVGWTALFWADRRLRALMFYRAGAPVVARQWTLPRYLAFMLRQYLLVILVPMLVLLGANEAAARLLPEPLAAGTGLAVLVAAVLFAGPWVCFCWRTESLPEGRLRQRLLGLASRAGIRVADVRIWRTNLSIANGCMIGLLGPLRYVLITDALLLSLSAEEAEAVFAHEAAHVTYRHPLLYFVMTLAAVSVAVAMGEAVGAVTLSPWIGLLTSGTVVLAYLAGVFGYVSRRCEQECDLFAVRATTCPEGCSPPEARRRRPPEESLPEAPDTSADARPALAAPEEEDVEQGRDADPPDAAETPDGSVCRHRVRTFIAALRRIARLNGSPETRRGLRHFSIARRCRFLETVLVNPSVARRSERRIGRMKRVALLLAVLALFVAALAVAVRITAVETMPLETDEPEHPTRPEDDVPWENTWIVRLVDRHEVNAVCFAPPEFDRDADVAAQAGDGRVPLPRGGVAPTHDDVTVADAGGHAVAVHPQGEGAGVDPPEPRQTQELRHALRRRDG